MTARERMPAIAIAVSLATTALVGCSAPGSSSEESAASTADVATALTTAATAATAAIEAPVTKDQVAALGEITLDVWADAGEQTTLDVFVPAFEARYPNVQVNLTVKGFDDLIRTVVPALNTDNPPDVAQGNQGYAVDGALVNAALIRPLDDLAAAYGWTEQVGEGSLSSLRWNADGTAFGAGSLYGMAPVTQYIGLFYNQDLLDGAGVTLPTTFAQFEASLGTLKTAGTTPIVFGNAEKYPAIHLFGGVSGAYESAAATQAWINAAEGAVFDTAGNAQTATTIASWAADGYLTDGFNGISADDAVSRFVAGDGAYFIAGSWNIDKIAAAEGGFGFTVVPPGDSGEVATMGSLGLPWHISAATDAGVAAAAFVGELNSVEFAQPLADLGRTPVMDTTVTSEQPLYDQALETTKLLLDDDGQTGYYDWTTDTMYDEFGSRAQELLGGRITPGDFVTAVQANAAAFNE